MECKKMRSIKFNYCY